jgi:hypothetical protein
MRTVEVVDSAKWRENVVASRPKPNATSSVSWTASFSVFAAYSSTAPLQNPSHAIDDQVQDPEIVAKA